MLLPTTLPCCQAYMYLMYDKQYCLTVLRGDIRSCTSTNRDCSVLGFLSGSSLAAAKYMSLYTRHAIRLYSIHRAIDSPNIYRNSSTGSAHL